MTKTAKSTPEPGESEDDFMARCTDNGGSEEECAMAWDERSSAGPQIVRKTHAATDAPEGMEFVLSDSSVDRMGDVIQSDGWDLANFKSNPIALFNHNKDAIAGRWHNLRVANGELRGHLELAPKGISARIDELRGLVEAGILKAVSVGFRPIKKELLDERADPFFGPFRFLKSELVETSLVSVPANPNALAVAKSLNISDDTRKLVFAEPGTKKDENVKRRGSNGEHVDNETLKTIYEWSPAQARRMKEWAINESKNYPSNSMYRKLQRLMEEIETVRTIQLLSSRRS
jgi:HK97 family phage prohead protease